MNGFRKAIVAVATALVLVGVSLSRQAMGGDAGLSLLVGDRACTVYAVNAALGPLGHVVGRDPNGLFEVQVAPGVSFAQAQAMLLGAHIQFVMAASAKGVEANSLPSVRDHIEYLEASRFVTDYVLATDRGVDFYRALEADLVARVGPDGKLNTEEIQRAARQRDSLPPAPRNGQQSYGPGGNWVNLGPKGLDVPYSQFNGMPPLSGRKLGIAIAPSNHNIIYVASAHGGIWVSKDAGVSWTPTSDQWAFQETSCVAVDPIDSNIVYAGTGEYINGAPHSQGVMKSTNGGASWTQLGSAGLKGIAVAKILVDPVNPNIILAAGGKEIGVSASGLYRSTDAGLTWVKVISNLVVDDLVRANDGVYYLVTSGSTTIKTSSNQGQSWTTVTNPCVFSQEAMSIAPSVVTAGIVYLLAPSDHEIYKSTNHGTSWVSVKGNFPNGVTGNTNLNWTDAVSNLCIRCTSNAGMDVVLVGLDTMAQSTGGSGTWIDLTQSYISAGPNYVHNDFHCIAVDPTDPSKVYLGCDGGIFRYTYSASPVQANFASLNTNLKDIMFYDIQAHPTDINRLMGGAQDNDTPASYGNLAAWKNLQGGDGGWSAFDLVTPAVHYTTTQQGGVYRYALNNGNAPTDISPTGLSTTYVTPIIIAGTGSDLFVGGTVVQKWSTGHTWNTVSPTLGGKATCLATSPTNLTSIYTGTDTGKLWRSANSGVNWNEITNVGDSRVVGAIALVPSSPNSILVGYQGTGTGHLWRTTDASVATPMWTNVSGTLPFRLPDTPINAIAIDPYETTRWYVGTDAGVFMTTDSGASWYNMNTLALPNVRVNSLRVNGLKNAIYAGTYGRGVYRLAIGPLAAPYSITGKVFQVGGVNALPNATLTLQKYQEQQTPFTLNPNGAIPDGPNGSAQFDINVGITQVVTGGTLSLNITHPHAGDLQVFLTGPDLKGDLILASTGAATQNIVADFDIGSTFNGLNTKGTWSITVQDKIAGNVGTVNQIKLAFKYNTYVTVQTKTSASDGSYTFPSLSAGSYRWSAAFTGKTFTPALRGGLLGPNMTSQNFTAN